MSREWTVRFRGGHWAASAVSAEHAAELVGLFDRECADLGPHTAHHSDPAKALVGPLPTVGFHDGHASFFGERVRVVVDQLPPRDTTDGGRWDRCADHRLACDCREAELAEDRAEWRGLFEAARQAADEVLAGHRTWPESYRPIGGDYSRLRWSGDELALNGAELDEEALCRCTGCEIARKAGLR